MRRADREALALKLLEFAGGLACEVMVTDEDTGLTRFTHNAIHQNVAHRQTAARVRAIVDGRTGVAAGNDLGDDALRAVVRRAREIAALAPKDDGAAGLAKNAGVSAPPGAYVEGTANADASLRARVVADIVASGQRSGLWGAGFVTTGRSGLTIANSLGTLSSFDGTDCGLNVKQNGSDASGFAEAYGNDVAVLRGDDAGAVAADKALGAAQPLAVDPGAWTVILEPAAGGEFLSYLTDHFSARSFDEGSSFLSDGLGRKYAAENVTIGDDFAHPLHAGMPFDYEGYPKERLPLIERGVARNVVTDATWARRLGKSNTGHGLPAPSATGPEALHVVVSPGEKSREQLIAETPRGLLVSRFWYIRTVDQRKTIVTGMTRDGTFLIENGKVGRGVRNMRFNDSILEALGRAEFSNELVRTGGYSYSMVLPALKIDGFRFTSATNF